MDWNEVKKLAKFISRYDDKTNDWEYLEIVNINDLISLGLDGSELSRIKKGSIRRQWLSLMEKRKIQTLFQFIR